MKTFVGIDLGTTNSAICTYDGNEIRIWKSDEQNDVTPSAILFARRGGKYLGTRAYNSAPWQHENAAMLFKRLMGTSTPIQISALDHPMTPEECSAEILKLLFGYLPEEIRNDPDIGTVITVPAAFNQMQKDATMQAAEKANIGKVALMQEPVAAVMSVMRARNTDGMFLIYDLGGGTLDIAIAESTGGKVNLLAHGGIAMCGGRDFDRLIMDNIVKPWMLDNFDIPEDFSVNQKFERHRRVALWATEKAKIELSAKDEATIYLSEEEMRCKDMAGAEMFLEIPLKRETVDRLISEKISESIDAARETLSKAGITPHDLERIVFVGGPTNYKPLRDKVSFELGIPGSTLVNPMTAVAEGASLFAESIDWATQSRSRKTTRGQISSGGDLPISFNFIARTPDVKSKIAVQITSPVAAGSEFQIDSIDTGWTSGRMPLKNGVIVEVILSKNGDNTFKAFIFDPTGGPISMKQDKIVITRTAATVDAIPASHSIGLEVLEKMGGKPVLHYLVKAGESLPKKGKETFKAAHILKAGDSDSLNFKLWEGEIPAPIHDNRFIGVLKVSGKDFDAGVIPAGGKLDCDFEILDSGHVMLEVSIPDIKGVRSGNFYSWQDSAMDYSSPSTRQYVIEEADTLLERLDAISAKIEDSKLDTARDKLDAAASFDPDHTDPETAKEAHDKIHEAKNILAQVRQEHLKELRQIDLDRVVLFFDEHVREFARPSEEKSFDTLSRTAQGSIERNDNAFEGYLDELRGKNFDILWRQDWFVVDRFKWMSNSPRRFGDKRRYEELIQAGMQFMQSDDIDKLRAVVAQLSMIQIEDAPDSDISTPTNIIRG